MMKTNIRYKVLLSATAALLLMVVACDSEKPIAGGANIIQSARLMVKNGDKISAANPYSIQQISIDDVNASSVERGVRINLFKTENRDVTAKVVYSKEDAERYQKALGTHYDILPESLVELPAEIVVKEGEVMSEDGLFKVKLTDEVEFNKTYLFALRLGEVDGAQVIDNQSTLLYTVERIKASNDVVKSIRLTPDVYFQPEKDFSDSGRNVTIEGLICIEKFNGMLNSGNSIINTFMGIEGKFLLRFGDAGVPANHLQTLDQHVTKPDFEPGVWYHIALVADDAANTKTLYVNGKPLATSRGPVDLSPSYQWGNRYDFLIGRSWDDKRGINARMAELRVWRTTRTQEELEENMMFVEPETPGLMAYWKMNSASGDTVADATGHGHDLVLKRQLSSAPEEPKVTVVDETSPIEIL